MRSGTSKKLKLFSPSPPCGGAVCLLSCVCSYENCFHTKAYCTMPLFSTSSTLNGKLGSRSTLPLGASFYYHFCHNVRPKRHKTHTARRSECRRSATLYIVFLCPAPDSVRCAMWRGGKKHHPSIRELSSSTTSPNSIFPNHTISFSPRAVVP